MELRHKAVFHIPLMAYKDEKLVRLDIDRLFEELVKDINTIGCYSFYVIEAMGYYKNRSYPEYLVTLFCDDDTYRVTDIFRKWFRKNNETLLQESMAYELEGGRETAEAFMKKLKLAAIETHVADARTCCLNPATSTHRQMNDEQRGSGSTGRPYPYFLRT